jgi:hypothetical protein
MKYENIIFAKFKMDKLKKFEKLLDNKEIGLVPYCRKTMYDYR